jgi:hypothetical protein
MVDQLLARPRPQHPSWIRAARRPRKAAPRRRPRSRRRRPASAAAAIKTTAAGCCPCTILSISKCSHVVRCSEARATRAACWCPRLTGPVSDLAAAPSPCSRWPHRGAVTCWSKRADTRHCARSCVVGCTCRPGHRCDWSERARDASTEMIGGCDSRGASALTATSAGWGLRARGCVEPPGWPQLRASSCPAC